MDRLFALSSSSLFVVTSVIIGLVVGYFVILLAWEQFRATAAPAADNRRSSMPLLDGINLSALQPKSNSVAAERENSEEDDSTRFVTRNTKPPNIALQKQFAVPDAIANELGLAAAL